MKKLCDKSLKIDLLKQFKKTDPRYFFMIEGGSAFFTFSLSATVWPQMSKMLMRESGTTGDSVQLYREPVFMNLPQH